MEIRLFGGGKRLLECVRILTERLSGAKGELLLLPIPTARDKKYITDTDVRVEDVLPFLSPDVTVVGYNIPAVIESGAASAGVRFFDASLDEEFLLGNAILTAKGTLGYLLTRYDRDVADLSIGVVGYGRIGRELVRLLLLLGGRVKVYTTRPSVALELGESGVMAEVIGEKTDCRDLDILINTAPAKQLDEERLPPELDIIDLASGSIFEPSGRLIKLSSVPDKFYPKTAGRLYAEAALRFLRRQGGV